MLTNTIKASLWYKKNLQVYLTKTKMRRVNHPGIKIIFQTFYNYYKNFKSVNKITLKRIKSTNLYEYYINLKIF